MCPVRWCNHIDTTCSTLRKEAQVVAQLLQSIRTHLDLIVDDVV